MINGALIADAFFEEARLFSDSIHSPASDKDERWRQDIEASPLPSREHLGIVLEEMFWASLMNDEGRPCRPRLIHFDGVEFRANTHPFHTFVEPITIDRYALRKLVPIAGDRGYLIWRAVEGAPRLVGVQAPLPVGVEPIRVIAESTGRGAIDIRRHVRLVLFRDGRVLRLSQHPRAGVAGVFLQLYFLSRSAEGAYGYQPILQEILQQEHGGSVWFVPDGTSLRSLEERGVKVDRPLAVDPRPPSERYTDESNRVLWLRSIGSLAAADGSVLVDSKLRVLGFGAFIQTPDRVQLKTIDASGAVEVVDASTRGGARHRAAAQFCTAFGAGSAAIVVSQDGRISVLAVEAGAPQPLCTEVIDLGFRFDSF